MALLSAGPLASVGARSSERLIGHTRSDASSRDDPFRQRSKHKAEAPKDDPFRQRGKHKAEASKNDDPFRQHKELVGPPELPNGFLGRVPDDPEVTVPKASPEEPNTGCDTLRTSATLGVESASLARLLAHAQERAQARDSAVTRQKKMFNLASGCLVLINVVVIALETDLDETLASRSTWLVIDALFLLAYTIEIGIRMYWERWGWTLSMANWLDAVVTFVGLITLVVLSSVSLSSSSSRSISTIRLIKLVRLAGLMKLVRAFQGLYVILRATSQAAVTMCILVVFVFFGFLIYSIFAVSVIGRNTALDDVVLSGKYTVNERFGTILRSMYTLFELMILEGWESISRPLVEKEPLLFFFIFSFIGIFTFGMMNMIVAVVIEKTMASTMMMEEQLNEVKKEQMVQELEVIKELISNAYCHEDIIRLTDLEAALQDHQVIGDFFSHMGFTLDEIKRLYTVLDWDGDGDLTINEFFGGITKLQFPEYSIMNLLALHTTVRQSRSRLAAYKRHVLCELEDFQIWYQALKGWQQAQASVVQEAEECLNEIFRKTDLTDPAIIGACSHDDQADTRPIQALGSTASLSTLRLGSGFKTSEQSEPGVNSARCSISSPTPAGVSAPLTDGGKSCQMRAYPSRQATMEEVANRHWNHKNKRLFDVAMGSLIIVNVFLIALETDIDHDEEKPERLNRGVGWIIIDTLFVLIFLMEIAVRAYFQRWVWFQLKWNWFDVLLTLMAMIDVWILSFMEDTSGALSLAPVIRIFRLLRLVRLLKLIRIYTELYVVLMSLGQTLLSMCNLLLIMFFGVLVYSIFTVQLIGRNSSLQHVRIMGTDTVNDRFGSIFRSMYSLFELLTLEGWDMVFRPILTEEPWLFFVVASFIMIFSFGLLNMIIAMVIQKTIHFREVLSENQLREDQARMLEELRFIRPLVNFPAQDLGSSGSMTRNDLEAKDLSRSGSMTRHDFEATLRQNTGVQKMFMDMGCSRQEALDFFEDFDWDGHGENTLESFCEGLLGLQVGNATLWHLLATQAQSRSCERGLRRLGKLLNKVLGEEEQVHAEIDKFQSAQDEALVCLGQCLDHLMQAQA